jgi:hypothetical protein
MAQGRGELPDGRDQLRAADADRQAVAERLRAALDEGRLDLHEYDTRLGEAYAAKTYGELDRVTADLPATGVPVPAPAAVPAARSGRVVAGSADVTRQWLFDVWDEWAGTVAICVAIWLAIALLGGGWQAVWPIWVAGPWGAYLAYQTARGLATGEPQRWAAKQEAKRLRKEQKRAAKGELPEAPETSG